MNEKLLSKVFRRDPRENRDKTSAEIVAEWRDRRLIGVVLKVVGFVASLVFVYWYAFERSQRFTLVRRLPFKARWSLGLAVFAFFAWLVYAFFGYRCPKCSRFHQLDWAPGAWLLGFREPPSRCRNCGAQLN